MMNVPSAVRLLAATGPTAAVSGESKTQYHVGCAPLAVYQPKGKNTLGV